MAAATKVWEKLIQPLRDLADLWSVDIEGDLTAYLAELHAAALALQGPHVNFAEAAVVIQNSTQYYSKKVEQLAVLVYTVLEQITENKRRELQADGRASEADDRELNVFEAEALADLLTALKSPQPHLLHDFLQTSDSASRRPARNVLATCDCLPFEDFEKSEKNYRMQVAELSDRCCLLVNPDSAFLVSNQPAPGSMASLDLSRIPAGSQLQSLDSSQGLQEVHRELGDLLAEREEEKSVGGGPGDYGDDDKDDALLDLSVPSFADALDGQAGPEEAHDPLADFLADPYDVSQNVVQPFAKGAHERRVKPDAMPHLHVEFLDGTPDAAFETGFLLTAQVVGNEPIRGRKPLAMSSLEDVRREEARRRRQEARERSDRVREEAQRLRDLLPRDVDGAGHAAKHEFLDDDLDADDNASDDFAEPAPMESSIAGLYTPTQADKWVQEAVQQMSQYQQLSEAEVAVHERVSNWTKRLEPLLNLQEQEEQEKPFKLYHYADSIMEHFKRSKVVNFADVVVPDHFTDDRKIHISRTFLACLQLANNGNVDLQHKTGLVSSTCPLFLRFLKAQQEGTVFEAGRGPITDISNVAAEPPPAAPEGRPPKRKKVAP